MPRIVSDWLDDRIGYRRLWSFLRRRPLPNGPTWGYSIANCLFWLLVVQGITGFLLMLTYTPSMAGAWASVHFIEQDAAGAFLRGVHYFAAQAMIVLFAVHVIRVLVTASFRAPHELVWITGLLLLPLMLVWMITGNPLSGSQKGMAQIEVEGNIIGATPVVGAWVRQLLIGGERPGQLTLTHLYALHVALLPLLVGLLFVIHLHQVYRHGLAPLSEPERQRRPTSYWPDQTVRNMVLFGVLFGTVAVLAWKVGAPLDAPADPELPHTPRPEWYFLWLFELRGYFATRWEFLATIVVPAAVLLFLLAIPFFDRVFPRRASAVMRWTVVLVGCGAWAGLTGASLLRDARDDEYQASLVRSTELAHRARVLADRGPISPQGSATLLRNDPKTQGPLLFAKHCAACHAHVDEQGRGIEAEDQKASNLYAFASRGWIAGLFDPAQIAGEHYFGNTSFADGDMVDTIQTAFQEAETEQHKAELRQRLQKVAWALSAEAALPAQVEADRREAGVIDEGRKLLTGDLGCTECHKFRDEAGLVDEAPDLTGYGSKEWLIGMISDPGHDRFYTKDHNDGMPAFAADPSHPENNVLTPQELELLADWLRGDWYEPSEAVSDQPSAFGPPIQQAHR